MKITTVTFIALSSISFSLFAENSVLRVRCDDNSAGAEIYINGKLKGECPINFEVPEGTLRLRAHRDADEEHEQILEQELHIGGGVIKTIDLELPAPRMTAKAILARLVNAANRGDIAAMEELARRYTKGDGVPKDTTQARAWHDKAVAAESAAAAVQLKAAQAGDIEAMDGIAKRYEAGQGVQKDPAQAQEWRRKSADVRQAQAAQLEKERRLQQIDYTANIGRLAKNLGDEHGHLNSTGFTSWVVSGPVATLSDLSSTPFNMTEENQIKNAASVRPAKWAKPDSMIARAASQQQQAISLSEEEQNQLVALK